MQVTLLVVGGAAFVAAFVLRSTKPDLNSAAWALFGLGATLAVAAVVIPALGDSGASTSATIRIVSPTSGSELPANDPFTVEVDLKGGDLATSATDTTAGHIHIYVDDFVVSMPTTTTAEIELDPGSHEIKAEYVDGNHAAFDPPVTDTVKVTATR